MPFQPRSFQAVLEDFKASNPKKTPKSYDGIHYAARTAWSFKNLSRWPSAPPVTTLAQVNDPRNHSEDVFKSAASLVRWGNFGNAIGTWNAGGQARFVHQGEDWILARVSLTQEQADDEEAPGDYVDYLLALWRLSDGWAAAVLSPGEQDLAVKLIGLDAWPEEGWKVEKVWFGE